jgi:DNA topoisomerase-3
VLAKPDLTGTWEYRLAQMAEGRYARKDWDVATREMVQELVSSIRDREGGNEEIFAVDHPKDTILKSPVSGAPLIEKTFSYLSSNPDEELSISKDQKGKYLFPETLARLLANGQVGPLSGFEGTRAPGILKLTKDGLVEIELIPTSDADDDAADDQPSDNQREQVPDGTVMGKCPKCASPVTRDGSGYRCEKNIPRKKDKECDFRLAERIKYRYLPAAQIKKILAGEKTDELFGFISMRGKKFKASLYYEAGELKWEFPPRKPRVAKAAKKTAKKAAKKATKKTTKKAAKKTTKKPTEETDADK